MKSQLGMTWAEIAAECGVCVQAVKQWKHVPKWHHKTLLALAKQRGVEISAEEILS